MKFSDNALCPIIIPLQQALKLVQIVIYSLAILKVYSCFQSINSIYFYIDTRKLDVEVLFKVHSSSNREEAYT